MRTWTLSLDGTEPTCVQMHTGLWMIEPEWFGSALDMIERGTFVVARAASVGGPGDDPGYAVDGHGIAHIALSGPLQKGVSKFGGTSTINARRQIRAATADESVRGIMLRIDSPGGTVAGTESLAGDVATARQRKPVRAHIDDLGASAAYWAAVATEHVTANATAQVGSIGTMAVVHDSSAEASDRGIKVHVVSTGALKGAFAPGTEITPPQIAYLQGRIDSLNGHFLGAVRSGRGIDGDALEAVSDGGVWIAESARDLRLIDGVMSSDDAIGQFSESIGARAKASSDARRRRLRIAGG